MSLYEYIICFIAFDNGEGCARDCYWYVAQDNQRSCGRGSNFQSLDFGPFENYSERFRRVLIATPTHMGLRQNRILGLLTRCRRYALSRVLV